MQNLILFLYSFTIQYDSRNFTKQGNKQKDKKKCKNDDLEVNHWWAFHTKYVSNMKIYWNDYSWHNMDIHVFKLYFDIIYVEYTCIALIKVIIADTLLT